MTETIIAPQIETAQENCEDRQAKLYEAIRTRISESFFSRIKIDEEELLHVIFMKLVDRFLPAFGTGEMTALLDDEMASGSKERSFRRMVPATILMVTLSLP